MAKFIQIENVVFNVEEIQKFYQGYFNSMAEQYWYVKVVCKDAYITTYKFVSEQESIDFLDEVGEKLGAIVV